MGDLVTGDGYRARMTCGDCPVQIEGEVDGHALYFRARGGIWSIGISRDKLSEEQKADVFALFVPPDTHPIAQAIDGPYQYADSGLCDDHMDHELAWKMVLGAIKEFRNPTQDEDYLPMSGQEKAGRWTPHVVPMHAVSSSGESLAHADLPAPIYPPLDAGSGYRWALVSAVWQVTNTTSKSGDLSEEEVITNAQIIGRWVWTWERRRIS